MFLVIQGAARAFLQRRRSLFQRRVERGEIRDCHGDLRAGHIYFADGIYITGTVYAHLCIKMIYSEKKEIPLNFNT